MFHPFCGLTLCHTLLRVADTPRKLYEPDHEIDKTHACDKLQTESKYIITNCDFELGTGEWMSRIKYRDDLIR
jgi:hypothetical protein